MRYFILAVYFIIVITVTLFQDIVGINTSRIIAFISGVLFLLLEVYRIKKLKEDCGRPLVELETEIKSSPILSWTLALLDMILIIAWFWLLYRSPESLPLTMLVFFTIDDLYLRFCDKPAFTEKGLLIKGILIKWKDFESFNWGSPTFNKLKKRKNYTKLVLTKKICSLGTYDINLMITNSQKAGLENLLRQRINN